MTEKSENKRAVLISIGFSVVFTFLQCIGAAFENFGTIFVKYNFGFCFLMFAMFFTAFFVLLKSLPAIQNFLEKIKFEGLENTFFRPEKKCFLFCMLFIILCHLPVFLAYYPGIFTYDTMPQIDFFVNGRTTEINPILHSLLLYIVYLFSAKIHTTSFGVFIYTLIQSLFIISSYAYCIYVMSKYKTPVIIMLSALTYFALYPSNAVMPLISTKDVFCTGMITYATLFIVQLFIEREKFFESRLKTLFLFLSLSFMFLFGQNSVFVYILALPPLLLYSYKHFKLSRIKVFSLLIMPFILFLAFSGIKHSCGIRFEPVEPISVPIQQLFRANILYPDMYSADKQTDYEKLAESGKNFSYCEFTVDCLKFDNNDFWKSSYITRTFERKKDDFLKLYFQRLKEHPKTFADAFYAIVHPYLYLPYKYETKGLYYYIYTEYRWTDFFGTKIEPESKLPAQKDFYDNIFMRASFVNNPVSTVLFSFSVNFMLIIACFFILVRKKRYDLICAAAFIFCGIIVNLFVPVALFRYIYRNFVILPLILAFCFCDFAALNGQKSRKTL